MKAGSNGVKAAITAKKIDKKENNWVIVSLPLTLQFTCDFSSFSHKDHEIVLNSSFISDFNALSHITMA